MPQMFRLTLTFILFLALPFSAVAAPDESDLVKTTVEKNVKDILRTFEEQKPRFETDPDGFYVEMEKAISSIIDFRRIAARVMGKYARKATKDQRNEFVESFKESLFNTYTKAIVDQGSFEMRVVKAQINPRSDTRASVEMEVITSNGSVYPVTYSMYKNKEGRWYMENVIVFGINIGLAFRDKFDSEMKSRKGDIEAVISNWSVDLEIDVPEGAGPLEES
ncbi:hypothetical protein A3765_10275 [Oleiphilus sp. HI0130]|nr:hypothetical protein A3765_10275 [Oleiphilus sp. HI0130]